MKRTLLILLFVVFTLTTLPAQEENDCSELFFSEYVEGSGNNKALEIYNPTDHVIDLSYYWVARYSNGSSNFNDGGITQLEGFLPPHEVLVFVNGQKVDKELGGGAISPKCDPALQAIAENHNPGLLDHDYPAPTYMNGNDAIGLLKSESNESLTNPVAVDLIGQIGLGDKIKYEYGWSYVKDSLVSYHYRIIEGDDTTWVETAGRVIDYIVQHTDTAGTAPFGPYWMAWTKDHTLVRKRLVKHGVTANPDGFDVSMEWDTVPGGRDVWDSLGFHTCNCGVTAVHTPADDPLEVYTHPNPVTYNTFEVVANHPLRRIEVTNLLGQHIYREELGEAYERRHQVYLPANTPPGLYLVRVTLNNDRFAVRKILVK